VFWLISGVYLVTGLARTSLLPVDVEKMEVLVAVSKTGQSCGVPIEGDILVVTVKTQCVILGAVRHIELGGERFLEDLGVGGPMRIVTGITVVLPNRAMDVLGFPHLQPHGLVAGVADLLGGSPQLPWIIGGVWRVADSTLFLFQCTVFYRGLPDILFHILVAPETEVLAFGFQLVPKIARVGIMTVGAILGRRLVFVFEFKLRLPVQMAQETQVRPLQLQQVFVIGRVRIMADIAISGSNGPMHELLVGLVVLVAGKTQRAYGLLLQLFLGVGLVRIMAGGAFPLFDGAMDNFTGLLGLMTQVAKGLSLGRELEVASLGFGGMCGFSLGMADRTLPYPNRAVNEFSLPHAGMTLSSHTVISVCRIPIDHDQSQGQEDRKDKYRRQSFHLTPPMPQQNRLPTS